MSLTLFALATALTASAVDTPLASRGFESAGDEDGIHFYIRPDSRYIWIGAEGEIAASPDTVRRTLLDYARHAGRLPNVVESEILDQTSSGILAYQRLSLPVIDDRDYVLQTRWQKKADAIHIRTHAVRNFGPATRDGIVRVVDYSNQWYLEPTADGHTKARLEIRIDLQSIFPTWMIRGPSATALGDLFATVEARATASGPLATVLSK